MTEPTSTVDVALCQYELDGVDGIDALLDRTASLFDRAGAADVYVLPELFVADLVSDPSASAADTALDADEVDRLHGFLDRQAGERQALIVGGSYNVLDDGELLNRCPIARPDGELLTYDKRHPTPSERDGGKRAGSARPPVVEHAGVRVGILVCYDVEFPETVRRVVDDGAELLAVPSWTQTEAGHQRVRRCAAARAVENQAYVAYVPLVGEHLGDDWRATGRASAFAPCDDVVGAQGTRLSLPQDEHAAGTCRLNVDALRESRSSGTVRPYSDYRESISATNPPN